MTIRKAAPAARRVKPAASRGADAEPDAQNAAASLLGWYDRHARSLPWRVSPADRRRGAEADAYAVWLSEVMLQQTTVATVTGYFERFLARWPTVNALAAADRDDVLSAWAGLGYYARARNLHACAQTVAERHGGVFPATEAELRDLPGVGAYTAAAIAAIAFDRPAVVVDGNVERVIARLRRIETPLPDAKPEIRAAAAALTPTQRPGDYAQAVMDLGATICTPRGPVCGLCPWRPGCAAHAAGVAETLPRKKPKAEKPTRRGAAFVALDPDDHVLMRRRPDKGLLGGMLGLPGTDWTETAPAAGVVAAAAPCRAGWADLDLEARHSFTHFHLRLQLFGAVLERRPAARDDDLWIPRRTVFDRALPTLMAKALKLALPALGP